MTGKCTRAGTILLILLLLPVIMPMAGAQGSGSLTRGRAFTVTVIGNSRTPYYLWVKGTFAMSGEPGDQPPVIAPGQVDVVQDPPGGPYAIGSHPISGGGGRTILDDVAPSSSVVPNTSYYTQVTTGRDGHGVVEFRTSQATATQQFQIVAENPADPNEDVAIVLGVPARIPIPTMLLPLPATTSPPPLPAPTGAGQVLIVPSTPMETPVPPRTAELTETPLEKTLPQETPVQEIPLADIIGVAAAGIVFLLLGRDGGGR